MPALDRGPSGVLYESAKNGGCGPCHPRASAVDMKCGDTRKLLCAKCGRWLSRPLVRACIKIVFGLVSLRSPSDGLGLNLGLGLGLRLGGLIVRRAAHGAANGMVEKRHGVLEEGRAAKTKVEARGLVHQPDRWVA